MQDTVIRWVFIIRVPDWQAIRSHVPEHLNYLEKLKKEKKLFVAGSFPDETGGLIILQAGSEQEARDLMDRDPYFTHHVASYEVHPWRRRF